MPKSTTLIDPPRRKWIAAQPCIICELGQQSTPTECAHVHTRRNAGDDHNLIPLCRDCHAEQHRIGVHSFEAKHMVSLEALAHEYWTKYDAEAFGET